MLKRIGHWIGREEYIKAYTKERDISERLAQKDISKAFNNGKIKKHRFQDGSVIYGLDEFGSPAKTEVIERVVKPSRLGFWDFWNRRAERKRQEREREYAEIDREIRTSQYRRACNHAESLLKDDDALLVNCDRIRLEKRKEYGLDDA